MLCLLVSKQNIHLGIDLSPEREKSIQMYIKVNPYTFSMQILGKLGSSLESKRESLAPISQSQVGRAQQNSSYQNPFYRLRNFSTICEAKTNMLTVFLYGMQMAESNCKQSLLYHKLDKDAAKSCTFEHLCTKLWNF